jgi:hypothetical protein
MMEICRMIKYPLYVTFDTNIIDENQYDFSESGTLSLLSKYVEQGKKVVLSVVEIFTDLNVWMGIRKVIENINDNAIAA